MKFVKVLENYVSQQNLDSLVFRELPTNKHLKYLKTDDAKVRIILNENIKINDYFINNISKIPFVEKIILK